MMGEVLQGGGDIARYAAIELGLTEVPGVAFNRHCASGMAPVQSGAASIMAGMDDVIIAGGAESISTSPSAMKRMLPGDELAPWMSPSHPETPDAPAFDMSITVGQNTADKFGITREDMDAWAYRSHMRAVAAIDEGRLQEEIFPIEVTLRDGTVKKFDVDEHPRRESSMEKLGEPEAAPPRDRGLRRHRRQLVGAERRGLPRSCSSTASTPRRTASSRSPRSSRGRRSAARRATRASARSTRSRRRSTARA